MKSILKDNKVILILILTVGLLLRLWNLNKPEGLWNDEYITFSIAMLKFPFDFFEGIKSNCHAYTRYPKDIFVIFLLQQVQKEFFLNLETLFQKKEQE